jgi:CBS domain-containing protein
MSSPVVVVRPNDSLAHVRNLMLRYRIGRVVVVDDAQRVVGIVTRSDLARAALEAGVRTIDTIVVEEVMTRNPVTTTPQRSLRFAARVMLEKGVSGLPVVDESGRLVGIITKTDIVRAYAEKLRGRHRVDEYMETEVPTAAPTHSLPYVVSRLVSSRVKRVLVVESRRLVGIIAPSDIAFFEEPVGTRGAKSYRRFELLDKGRLGPVYYYLAPIAADVMTPNPACVKPGDDLAAAAQLMLRLGVSSVPVVTEDQEPLGIVLKHSLLRAVVEG